MLFRVVMDLAGCLERDVELSSKLSDNSRKQGEKEALLWLHEIMISGYCDRDFTMTDLKRCIEEAFLNCTCRYEGKDFNSSNLFESGAIDILSYLIMLLEVPSMFRRNFSVWHDYYNLTHHYSDKIVDDTPFDSDDGEVEPKPSTWTPGEYF